MLNAIFRPLINWPSTVTPTHKRKRGTFKVSWPKSLDALERELLHLKAREITIYIAVTSAMIRNDGWPRSDARPSAPGVVLSFERPSRDSLTFACDTYTDWQANLRAICLTLEALRAVDRYGATQRGEQYRGFAALPPATNPASALATLARLAGWSQTTTQADLPGAYRSAAKLTHPDHGGQRAQWDELQQAKEVLGL